MSSTKIEQIQLGLTTAFIDSGIHSNLAYQPQFNYNNHNNGQKVISSI